jgi:cytosine/uracil/thiamine/allantoin permease
MKVHWKVSAILALFSLILWVAHQLILKHSQTELRILLVLTGLLIVAAFAHLVRVWVMVVRQTVTDLRKANRERKERGIRWHLMLVVFSFTLGFAVITAI